jgi:hypothetical protein
MCHDAVRTRPSHSGNTFLATDGRALNTKRDCGPDAPEKRPLTGPLTKLKRSAPQKHNGFSRRRLSLHIEAQFDRRGPRPLDGLEGPFLDRGNRIAVQSRA